MSAVSQPVTIRHHDACGRLLSTDTKVRKVHRPTGQRPYIRRFGGRLHLNSGEEGIVDVYARPPRTMTMDQFLSAPPEAFVGIRTVRITDLHPGEHPRR